MITNKINQILKENDINNNYYLSFSGGIGKLIMMSGAFNYLFDDNKNDNLFLINDNLIVYSNLNIKGYSIEDFQYINNNVIKLSFDPYEYNELLDKKINLSAICNYILNDKLEYIKPIILLSEEEKYFSNQFKNTLDQNKKILIIHPFASGCVSGNYDPYKKSFRDYFTKDLILRYKDEYNILEVHNENQYHFPDTISLAGKQLREIFAIISIADKVISCDTMTQHIAASLNIKSLVLWSITDEQIFGHPLHINYREFELDNYLRPIKNKERKKISPTINMFTEKTFNVIEDYLNE